MKKLGLILLMIGIVCVSVFANGDQEESSAAGSAAPTEINIAAFGPITVEEPWNTAFIQSMDRVIAEKPHGLKVNFQFFENIDYTDGERFMGELARTGKYDIIIAHSAYSDAVANVMDKFPDILFGFTGGGNTPLGKNAYFLDVSVHEPSYICGAIAGMMTKTNIISGVGSYPVSNETSAFYSYVQGAKSVNPDVKVKLMYIESWFDPAKAKESALAQISAGSDFMYAITFGVLEACKEKDVLAVGFNVDQSSFAPQQVVTSPIMSWDAVQTYAIDEWWNYTVNGVAYDAPMKPVVFSMAEGGSLMAPYHETESRIPQEVKDKVDELYNAIMDGSLVVEYSEEQVVSD